jgi:hypothetical protein
MLTTNRTKSPHDAFTTFIVGFLGGLAVGFLLALSVGAGW